MKYVILLAFLISGCNNRSSAPEQPQYDARNEPAEAQTKPLDPPDVITDGGLMIFNHTGGDIDLPARSTLDQWWTETQQCVSLESEAPAVIVSKNIRETCPQSSGSQAHYCKIEGNWYVVVLWDRLGYRHLWKHEFMHHLFRINGNDEYQAHEPDWIWQCQYN